MSDLEELAAYVANDSERTAAFVETRVHEAAQLIAQFPHAGRRGRVAGTRERVVLRTPYILTYRLQSDRIRILRVYRGARRWPARFE
jgi:toxin ParE1/3/4